MCRWKFSAAGVIFTVLQLVILVGCSTHRPHASLCKSFVKSKYIDEMTTTAVEKFTDIHGSSCFIEKFALIPTKEWETLKHMKYAFLLSKDATVRRFPLFYRKCSGILITEYIPFKLETYTKDTDVVESTFVIYGIVRAVQQIHSYGYVHLNLTPENIRIDVHGTVKLVNFKISECVKYEPERGSKVEGTMVYMPPEVLKGEEIQNQNKYKVDMWSVGAIVYEVLTRSRLVDIDQLSEYYNCVIKCDKPVTWTKEKAMLWLIQYSVKGSEPPYDGVMICMRQMKMQSRERFSSATKQDENNKYLIDAGKLQRLLFDKLLAIEPEKRATIDEVLKEIERVLHKVKYNEWLTERLELRRSDNEL